ncbi:MAG: response regulator [Deltaproteobacteria bacterium]|nr:response regulator [Deltaproteobacteria bacterium]
MKGPGPVRARILVVDDDPALLETTAALLSLDYDVSLASSGEEALKLFESAPFDVICTDFRMPGMDGLELLQRARAMRADVWGVVITGYREFTKSRPDDRNNFSLLFKPYDPAQLLDTLRQAVRVTEIRRSTAAASASARRPA